MSKDLTISKYEHKKNVNIWQEKDILIYLIPY